MVGVGSGGVWGIGEGMNADKIFIIIMMALIISGIVFAANFLHAGETQERAWTGMYEMDCPDSQIECGCFVDSLTDSTTSGMGEINLNSYDGGTTIKNVNLYLDKNQIEIIYQESSIWVYCNGQSPPDKVWKEIYGVVDGKITPIKTAYGKHIPSRIVDESIDWPED